MTRIAVPSLVVVCLGSAGCIDDGPTGLRGRIREAVTQAPLAGVAVAVGDDEVGWVEVTTDGDGWFEVVGIDPEASLMRLDGRPISHPGARYPSVTTQLHAAWIFPGAVTTIPADKYLPRIDDSTAVDLAPYLRDSDDPDHPVADGWRQLDPDGPALRVASIDREVPGAVGPGGEPLTATVYAELAPGTFVRLPEGEAPVLTVTQVPVDQLPHALPAYVSPLMMVTFQPGGTELDPPAPLHFGDLRGYAARAPDMPFSVWSLSHSLALFLELGGADLRDGDDGPEIATVEGVGLAELGWHGPVCTDVNFVAQVEVLEDNVARPPPDGLLIMDVQGGGGASGGFRSSSGNRGGRVETGTVSSCGGYFEFAFQVAGSGEVLRHAVPNWRCAASAGDNDLGTVVIDLRGATPTLSADFHLGAC